MHQFVKLVLLSDALFGLAVRRHSSAKEARHASSNAETINATKKLQVGDIAAVEKLMEDFPFEYLGEVVGSIRTLVTEPITLETGTAAVLDIATTTLGLVNPGLAVAVGFVRSLFDPEEGEPDVSSQLAKLRSELLAEVSDMIDSKLRKFWNTQIQTQLRSIAQIVEECCYGDALGKFGGLVTDLEKLDGTVAKTLVVSDLLNSEGGMSILGAIFYWNFYIHVGIQHAVMKLESGHVDAQEHAQGRQAVVTKRARKGVTRLAKHYLEFKEWRLSESRFERLSYIDSDKSWFRDYWDRIIVKTAKDTYSGKSYALDSNGKFIAGCKFHNDGLYRMLKKGYQNEGTMDYYRRWTRDVDNCISAAIALAKAQVESKMESNMKRLCSSLGCQWTDAGCSCP